MMVVWLHVCGWNMCTSETLLQYGKHLHDQARNQKWLVRHALKRAKMKREASVHDVKTARYHFHDDVNIVVVYLHRHRHRGRRHIRVTEQ